VRFKVREVVSPAYHSIDQKNIVPDDAFILFGDDSGSFMDV